MHMGTMSATSPRLLPLRARDHVALLVDALPALPATVVATGPHEATLLLGSDDLPARMLHRRSAVIETQADGRRYRGAGELAMASGRRGRVRDDTVVFHFAGGRSALRRVHLRAPAVLPVTMVPVRAELPPVRSQTVDISAGGALVRATSPVPRGQELLLHLELPEEDLPIPAAGEVVRRTADGLLGVRLDRMRSADRDLVMRWIQEQAAGGVRRRFF